MHTTATGAYFWRHWFNKRFAKREQETEQAKVGFHYNNINYEMYLTLFKN